MIFDQDGDLWLAGNKGISFIESEQYNAFLNGDIEEMRVAQIGTRKGLPVRETSGGFQPSAQLDEQGRLYIPLVQGIAVVHTNRMEINRKPPNVIIDGITVDGKNYESIALDAISYNSRRFEFDFAALSFINPEAVRYRYKLKGFEQQWNTAAEQPQAVYTSLQPGNYTLLVKASNNDGFWSPEPARLSFTVTPPFWEESWFHVVFIIAIGGIIYGLYQWRVYSIKRYSRRLEEEVEERTQELEETNRALKKHIDDKNKLFSILAHDLRNPFASIIGYMQMLKQKFSESGNESDLEMTSELLQVARNTHDLLENLLQWANARSGGLEPEKESVDLNLLVSQALDAISSQSRFKNISIDNSITPGKFTVKCDPNMITAVVRNLLSNAIKFSEQGTQVEIFAAEKDEDLIVSVKDYGSGIDEDNLETIISMNNSDQKTGTRGEKGIGMGLMLCKEFVKKHGGEIWVESPADEGSTFSFSLPLNKNGEK